MIPETQENEFWISFIFWNCFSEREFTKLLWYVGSDQGTVNPSHDFGVKMAFLYILVQNDRVVRTPWDEIDGKFDDGGKFAPTGNNRKINFFDLM